LNSPSKNKPVPSNWIVDFSIRQPVLANLAFVIIVVLGLSALFDLPRDINPNVSFETAVIVTPYPGATPGDVEKLVTIPIEAEIRDVKDLNRVYSRSEENVSVIVVEFDTGAPIKERVRDLRDEIDKVGNLPEETEATQVFELDTGGIPMISVVLSSETITEHDLKDVAEDLQDALEEIRGVSSVSLAGVREREIRVSADRSLTGTFPPAPSTSDGRRPWSAPSASTGRSTISPEPSSAPTAPATAYGFATWRRWRTRSETRLQSRGSTAGRRSAFRSSRRRTPTPTP